MVVDLLDPKGPKKGVVGGVTAPVVIVLFPASGLSRSWLALADIQSRADVVGEGYRGISRQNKKPGNKKGIVWEYDLW